MANKKIGDLALGTPQGADVLPVQRGATENYKLTVQSLTDLARAYTNVDYPGIATVPQALDKLFALSKGGLRHAATTIIRDAIPAAERLEGMLCYVDLPIGKYYQLQSDLTTWVEFSSGSGGSSIDVVQVAHGFTVADIGRPMRFTGATWVFAQADNPVNAESPGLIGAIKSVDEFTIIMLGPISNLGFTVVPGEVYFLSAVAPGALLITPPTAVGHVDKPMLLATGVNSGLVLQYRGMVIPSPAQEPSSGTTYLAAFNQVTPMDIFDVPLGQAIADIDVEITEAWDGSGAFITIGTPASPALFFAAGDTELTGLSTFSKSFSTLGPVTIRLTINPGLGPSTGKARIQVATTPSGT